MNQELIQLLKEIAREWRKLEERTRNEKNQY